MKTKEVYVVPHCHWDAEWYFTCEDSHILLVENIDYLLDLLESDADFPAYTFDGLSIVLEEYLQIRPENEARLKALIHNRRLFVGPWYTQCDTLLIRSESLIRNLCYGIEMAESFGHSMNIGYLPDVFGQHCYLPAIFSDLGIEYCVVQRGIYTDQIAGNLNLLWRAPNNKSIATHYLYYGYGPGKFLSTAPDYLNDRLLPILENLSAMNQSTDKLLLPCGGDQVLPNATFPRTVQQLNQLDTPYHFKMADYESYMQDAWSQTSFSNTIDGELFACQKSRIHRTCHSTRYDIKRQTWLTEHLLLDKLEPLAAIATLLDIPWPAPLMATLWKKVFSAHAHNGIEATNADAVNQNIKNRLISVERSALSLINLLKKKISHQITCQPGQENILVIFNGDICPQDQLTHAVLFTKSKDFTLTQNGKVIESTLIHQEMMDGGQVVIVTAAGEKLQPVENYFRSEILLRIPPMRGLGYQTLLVDESGISAGLVRQQTAAIENEHYRISLEGGEVTLENRLTGQRVENAIRFVDCGDDGDEFDFAPLADEQPLSGGKFTLIANETSAQCSRLILQSEIVLPRDMAARKAGIANLPMAMTTTLELRQGERIARVHHTLTNQATEHRLRVVINTPIVKPHHSYADQGYSVISRETVSPYVEQWREQGFVEKPMPIYTMENLVYLKDSQHLMGVITQGIKEYEVMPDENSIALTLFRSVGLLGKDNTAWRPGRASGINNKVVETPDALMLQTMEFDYALLLDGEINDAALLAACNHYRGRVLTYQVQKLNTFEERLERFSIPLSAGSIQPVQQFLAAANPNILLSMCKPGTDGREIVIRVFNPGSQPETLAFHSSVHSRIYLLSLDEKRLEQIANEITIAPKDYLTLAIDFTGGGFNE